MCIHMTPAAHKCNNAVISLFQMHSPWKIKTTYWAAVMLCDQLPILHAYLCFVAPSTVCKHSLFELAIYSIHILFSTQTN